MYLRSDLPDGYLEALEPLLVLSGVPLLTAAPVLLATGPADADHDGVEGAQAGSSSDGSDEEEHKAAGSGESESDESEADESESESDRDLDLGTDNSDDGLDGAGLGDL